MTNKQRLEKAENELDQRQPPQKHLIIKQDLDDPKLWHAGDETYTEAELDELRGQYQIIQIEYVKDWRGAADGGLTWPDD